jgi:hypothetical protein
MNSFLITNLCTKVRVQTKDEKILQVFSGFYSHPAMINEDGWHLQKHGNVNILVDEDTMHIMKKMLCEFGYDATSDAILTCKLTSVVEDEEERTKQWNELYEYARGVRKAAAIHFDKQKVSDLVTKMEETTISENTDLDSDASCSKT